MAAIWFERKNQTPSEIAIKKWMDEEFAKRFAKHYRLYRASDATNNTGSVINESDSDGD